MKFSTYQEYKNVQSLLDIITSEKLSQASHNGFHTVLRHHDRINSVEGDIIECGVWKGAFSIFLSKIFQTKNVWVCDSFDGFQDPGKSKYPQYDREFFTPNNGQDFVRVCLADVMANFNRFGLAGDVYNGRIQFLKGWVKDTLPNCQIDKISLLRVDVDAYSATREVLDYLYPKVVPGGMIIFDDSQLFQAVEAAKDYFESINTTFKLYHPDNDSVLLDTKIKQPDWAPDYKVNYQYPACCYTIKE
jgi:hypothetical protein